MIQLTGLPTRCSELCSHSSYAPCCARPPVRRRLYVTATAEKTSIEWLWNRKASGTRQHLRDAKMRPKKSMGQNYLVSDGILDAITRAAKIKEGQPILEVGPGTGNLTRHLLMAGADVTAVEKDDALFLKLTQEFKDVPNLHVIHQDVLQLNVLTTLDAMQATGSDNNGTGAVGAAVVPRGRIKVVANLPFYITTDFLNLLLPMGDRISHLYVMLQDEVALRLTRKETGGSDYRAMTLRTQYYSQPKYLFQIDRNSFFPAPKVHGAMVEFALRPSRDLPKVTSEKTFFSTINLAFAGRRKTLRNSLSSRYSPESVSAALEQLGLDMQARAQELTLQHYVDLHNILSVWDNNQPKAEPTVVLE